MSEPWQALAAIVGLLTFLALGLRLRRRCADPASEAPAHAASRRFKGGQTYRQVRWALYAVLLAAGGHTFFLAWQAEAAFERHAVEAEAANLAGRQRMYCQRVGLLASLLASGRPDGHVDRGSLGQVLAQAQQDAVALKEFLGVLPTPAEPDESIDTAAIARWDVTRQALYARAAELQDAWGRGEPVTRAGVDAVEAVVDPAVAAAEGLVAAIQTAVQARHRHEVTQSKLLAAATVVLLLGLALLVAEPTSRAVKSQWLQIAAQTRELERLALVAQLTHNAVMILDAQQCMVWVNDAFTRITGFSATEAKGHSVAGLLAGEPDGPAAAEATEGSGSPPTAARSQIANRRKDGSELWLDVDVQPLNIEEADAGFVAVATDVTERRRAQSDLRIAAIAFNSLEAIAITDHRQVVLRVNAAFTRITGYSSEEASGKVVGRLLRSGRHDAAFYDAMWQQLRAQRHWQGEVWNRRKDGEIYPEWLSITAVVDEEGIVRNYVAVFADITQKKLAEQTIHNLAFYDALTELPNRRLLRERLEHLRASDSRREEMAAVLFIDLDNFKELNDTRGHDVGDALLVEVAQRLRDCVRVHDTVARQGGDEFVIVLSSLHPEEFKAVEDVQAVAEKVRSTLSHPYALGDFEWHCSASIGICMLPVGEAPVDEVLKRADIAMYEAKRAGRNAVRFYDPATHEAIQQRISLETDLRGALSEGQFTLHFQPQVDAQRQTVGAEVLLRWNHPERGMVSPGEFIPVAEDTDLIVPIGRWVLVEACRQLQLWSRAPETRRLQLAVNVSARQFRQPDFVEQVRQVLSETGADPCLLKLELTESLVLVSIEDTLAKMQAIRALGVRFAIDDFGTGQSSLAYLTRLSLDQLKIDQAFVAGMLHSHTDGVVVQTMVGMAHSLGLDVIAEGVETEAQLSFLRSIGCGCYQGYLFGRPVPIERFTTLAVG